MATNQHPRQGRDDPPRSLVPMFSPPSPEELLTPEGTAPSLPPATEASPNPSSPRGGGPVDELDVPRVPSMSTRARTGTSTSGDDEPPKLTQTEAAALMAGLLALVVTGAAALLRWRLRADLREPTERQYTQIGTPLGKILMRHGRLAGLGPDIGDLLAASAAAGAYLGDGPLITPRYPDARVPDNLQEAQQ